MLLQNFILAVILLLSALAFVTFDICIKKQWVWRLPDLWLPYFSLSLSLYLFLSLSLSLYLFLALSLSLSLSLSLFSNCIYNFVYSSGCMTWMTLHQKTCPRLLDTQDGSLSCGKQLAPRTVMFGLSVGVVWGRVH